jgi:hypothetical protein
MDFEQEAIEVVLEDWNSILKKAHENEEFTNQEIMSLLWAKVILAKTIED